MAGFAKMHSQNAATGQMSGFLSGGFAAARRSVAEILRGGHQGQIEEQGGEVCAARPHGVEERIMAHAGQADPRTLDHAMIEKLEAAKRGGDRAIGKILWQGAYGLQKGAAGRIGNLFEDGLRRDRGGGECGNKCENPEHKNLSICWTDRIPLRRRLSRLKIGRFDTPGNGGRAAPVSSLSILPRCGSSAAERLPATPPVTAWRGMANLAGRWITLPQRPAFFGEFQI